MRDLSFKDFLSKYQKVPFEEYPNRVLETVPAPKVSVVISTYNHAGFIRECLDGALMQETDFPFEILIGEDQSNDGTREICIEYARRFPEKIRLFLHRRENNILVDGQPTGNFQLTTSLFISRAPYIAFCEGDDYWTDPSKLQKQFDLLESQPAFSVTYHSASIIDATGRQISADMSPEWMRANVSALELRCNRRPLTLTSFFRNVFDTIPEEFIRILNADSFLFSFLGIKGAGYFHQDIANAAYRKHSGGIWSTKSPAEQIKYQQKTSWEILKYHCRVKSDVETIRFWEKRGAFVQFFGLNSIAFRKNPISYVLGFLSQSLSLIGHGKSRLVRAFVVHKIARLVRDSF